ncbi:MAG TPA: FAD-dependent thymidylate synthase [Bacillota bacterium]|nr:FAD-dependent thymidylate synthase [Bacillota bacterium]
MAQKKLFVSLLRYTHNPEEVVSMGAKLCYSAAGIEELTQGIESTDQTAFIEKLMDFEHLSPVEHASFTFGIEGVSRALLAQITRHRIASFSVKSQRYVGESSREKAGKVFDYIIPPRIEGLGPEYVKEFQRQMAQMQNWYDYWNEQLGASGESSHEDARFVLPNAAETKMVVTMNARELFHFFNLRCCNRAQWEIRELAEAMLILVKRVAPVLFRHAGPGCVSGACPEGKMTCGSALEMREKYRLLN